MVNIGDVFILKYDEKDKKNRCVYYRKKYTITDLSKSKLTIFIKIIGVIINVNVVILELIKIFQLRI